MNNKTKINEWLHTGELENGLLQVWCKIDWIDGEKYLKVEYRDGDKVITREDYPVKHVRLLNGLVDCYYMEHGYFD